MADFKRLSDVEVVAEPTESANVLIEENGVIKKAPKTAVGGAGGSSAHWVMYTNDGIIASDGLYEDLENFFVNYDVPVNVLTYIVDSDEADGRVIDFRAAPQNHVSWRNDEFTISGCEGIIFYIRKDGNHSYYWD
jgi:hypothetical protein